jgi:hypothetical protein
MTHQKLVEHFYKKAVASLPEETAEGLAAARTWAWGEATRRANRLPSMEWLRGPFPGVEVSR